MPRAIPKLCPLFKHGIYEGRRCPKCAAEARARSDRDRPSAAARGYDAAWRRVRKDFLAAHPACCAAGCSQPATEVDHIQSVADRPDLRLSWSNLRGFCKPHHSQRTGREQGTFAKGGGPRRKLSPALAALLLPSNLRPSRIPLTIVCGPPGSGKTSYVRWHAGPNDRVIELDTIIERLSGRSGYVAGKDWLDAAMTIRNRELAALADDHQHDAAWFIVGAPHAEDREHWARSLRPRGVVVLTVPADVCEARLRADPIRRPVLEGQVAAVRRWWTDYRPRLGDTPIGAGGIGGLEFPRKADGTDPGDTLAREPN